MPQFKIAPEIAWGSIMSTVTILIGLAVGWTVMDERSKQTAAAVNEFKTQLSVMDTRFRQVEAASPQAAAIERSVASLEGRIRSAEMSGARTEERLIAIQTDVRRLVSLVEGRNGGRP